MPDADDLMERVRALAPEEFAAFRKQFLSFIDTSAARSRTARLVQPPSAYAAFDPELHDIETEALEQLLCERWIDDLRNLRTEAQVLAEEVQTGREAPSGYTLFRELYEAEHPRPERPDPPEAFAAWEWAHLDAYYERMEMLTSLARHRIQKGAFLARHTEIHRRVQGDGLLDLPTDGLPRLPHVKVAGLWPPIDPEEDLREYGDLDDPWDGTDVARHRATNAAYARADDLYCGAFGWMASLPLPLPDGWRDTFDAVLEAGSQMRRAAEGDFRPGHAAQTVLGIKRALPLAGEALLALDEASAEAWMTARAHGHLVALVVAARDALQDRLVEAREQYAGLWAVARRVLGSVEDGS